jgi:hypothetical protein
MDVPATLVWVAPEPPDAQQASALRSWSNAHGIRLSAPLSGGTPYLTVDMGIGETVETMLETARDAIAARDRQQADRALESADSILRAHPELPQSAWLMAEVQRAWSVRFRRVAPVDVEAAERSWLRAEALDGGRVPGVGEEDSPGHPSPARLTLDLAPEDEAWVDGHPIGPQAATFATRAGLHVLVVTRGGTPVWASWVDALEVSSTVPAVVVDEVPCSADDVVRASFSSEGIDGHRVRCPSWIAAIGAGRPGSVRVAVCEGGRCGTPVDWPAQTPSAWSTPAVERAKNSGWPAWATWTAVGAGVAIAATAVVFALQPTPTATRFVSGQYQDMKP